MGYGPGPLHLEQVGHKDDCRPSTSVVHIEILMTLPGGGKMKMRICSIHPVVIIGITMASLLVVPGCGNDDPVDPEADPEVPFTLPSRLVQEFGSAYTNKLTDSLSELLHPDFRMILPSETCELWNLPKDTTFDKSEMTSIIRNMFSGQAGRDVSGVSVPAVGGIAMDILGPLGEWIPITPETGFFGEYEGLWARYDINIQFHDPEQTPTFEVRQQVDFYVAEVTDDDGIGLRLLGIRELPMAPDAGKDLATWSAVLLDFEVESWTVENDYIGAEMCGRCHAEIYADYLVSGHSKPFMENQIAKLDPGDTECGVCHSTGYDPVTGTWEQDGVTCEACHGMGRIHSRSSAVQDIVINLDEEFCWECHDIFLSHPYRESGSTWRGTSHPGGCVPCHDPHISARLDIERAILFDCADCHTSDKNQVGVDGSYGRP
ncbi:MAG: multiheme c-type cytochrome, partial [Candidatus Krumholzibacteriota bacterium]